MKSLQDILGAHAFSKSILPVSLTFRDFAVMASSRNSLCEFVRGTHIIAQVYQLVSHVTLRFLSVLPIVSRE